MSATEPAVRTSPARWVCWSAVWLAVALVAVKAYYLGLPSTPTAGDAQDYVRSLAAISYIDVLFALVAWLCARTLVVLTRRRRRTSRAVSALFVAFGALACLYAVADVVMFGAFGGFLTYPLLAVVGSVRMIRSSIAMYFTPRVAIAFIAVPLAYVTTVWATLRWAPVSDHLQWRRNGAALASVAVWVTFGQHTFTTDWATRQGRQIAQNPHWVFISSWWQAVSGDGVVRIADRFAADDLADFAPAGLRTPTSTSDVVRRVSRLRAESRQAARRPPNVVVVVLESVGARWTSLPDGNAYDTTPTLKAESARGMVFDNFYAHIGRSSNSLGAILMSVYPKLDFRDLTEEYPRLPGTSIAAIFRDRGYRTAFMTPSDLGWAGWDGFLRGRGFDDLRDYHRLSCTEPLSSWGVEDRCMVDAMVDYIGRNAAAPFFVMGWTQQTHHPYEPTPGMPSLDLRIRHEPVPDDWNLGRYLNVLHETDHQVGRLFDAIRRAGLAQDTIVVVTGDHGQAFGYPHDSYMQGRTVYEEDVHVPLLIWSPRAFKTTARSTTLGSHVDLAPTIAGLAGVPPAADWQGHGLLDAGHVPRTYFYVAEDHFTLGVRENNWKYILDLREGTQELYDLTRDPAEQHNVASSEPARCARLRQRLAAWTEANRRQYERVSSPAADRPVAALPATAPVAHVGRSARDLLKD